MPGSKTTSTKVSLEFVVTEADPPTGEALDAFDPARVAVILRRMNELEGLLFASGLTKAQRELMGRLRTLRGPLWRMVPEGF